MTEERERGGFSNVNTMSSQTPAASNSVPDFYILNVSEGVSALNKSNQSGRTDTAGLVQHKDGFTLATCEGNLHISVTFSGQ